MDNLFEQMANISKASAYDIVSKQVHELKEENESLKQRITQWDAKATQSETQNIKMANDVKILREALIKARGDFEILNRKDKTYTAEAAIDGINEALNQTK